MSELEKRRKSYQMIIITLMVIIIALLLSLIFLFATGRAVQTITVPPPSSSSSEPIASSSSEPEPSSSSEPEPSSSSEPAPPASSSSVAPAPPPASIAPPSPPAYVPPPPPIYVPPVYVPPPVVPEPTVLDISQTGLYEDSANYESLIIRSSGVVVKNKTISGDLYISADVGKKGTVTLENVIVDGEMYIYGGAENTGIRLKDCSINSMTIQNSTDTIGVRVSGKTEVGNVDLKSDAYFDEDNLHYKYFGFRRIVVNKGTPIWFDIDLGATHLDELLINSPSKIHISSDGIVKEVIANNSLKLSGYGTVDTLRVKSDNITYQSKPGEIINPRGNYEEPTYSYE